MSIGTSSHSRILWDCEDITWGMWVCQLDALHKASIRPSISLHHSAYTIVHICLHIYIHTYIHIYIYNSIYIQTHTQTHRELIIVSHMLSNIYIYISYVYNIVYTLYCIWYIYSGLYIIHSISHISYMYYVFCMYICIYTPTLYVRINQLPRKLAVAWHTSATLRRLPWHTPSVGSPEHFEDKVSHQGHQLFDMFIYIYYIIL